eukprot:2002696-Prorocentrum_lima.AAC.1
MFFHPASSSTSCAASPPTTCRTRRRHVRDGGVLSLHARLPRVTSGNLITSKIAMFSIAVVALGAL